MYTRKSVIQLLREILVMQIHVIKYYIFIAHSHNISNALGTLCLIDCSNKNVLRRLLWPI